ncbi:hypothetical protein LU276_05440 [Moraxella haemolytica]|uniref:hypothetical protein n=1 Tax=Moraxella haemolytica TaxID=2904119 RepID=UPI00254310D8|nr:hypothetical protein [Moraxella sp. ZY171148]WII94484.1 hypothetical protein LU276_05440 [Moraxella sp. ZY171148]
MMQYEYVIMLVVLIMAWQNFSLRRKIKQLWQTMDKTKYIDYYAKIVHQTKDQTVAVKKLCQAFPELNLLQAVEISQIAHQQSAVQKESGV